jgi:hypothetical protein
MRVRDNGRSILRDIPILRVIAIERAGAASLFIYLAFREFYRGEPFVGECGDEVSIIIVGLEATKGKKVRPGGRSVVSTGVDGVERIIVNDMELWADVVGAKIANQPNSAGMER